MQFSLINYADSHENEYKYSGMEDGRLVFTQKNNRSEIRLTKKQFLDEMEDIKSPLDVTSKAGSWEQIKAFVESL